MPLTLEPLLKTLTIKTKDLRYLPLDLHFRDHNRIMKAEGSDPGWAQRPFVAEVERQYNEGKPVRIITLKARQLGISTITEAILFLWGFIHPGTNGLVLAQEQTPSAELFEMTKLYWDLWPFKSLYSLKYATKQGLHWLETGSRLKISTAKNIKSTRGSTINALHASEVAFWDDPETLWTGLREAIPDRHGTIVVLESTANGFGNWYHDMWLAAEEGESEFTPLFFPWFHHSDYRRYTTLTIASELSSEEKDLLRRGATFESIEWRRWKIRTKNGDVDSFMQEYPSTPEEAFITKGNPVFPPSQVRACLEDLSGHRGRLIDLPDGGVKFIRDDTGPLTIFFGPKRDLRSDRYFVAGDPSKTIGGDPACIQVINRQTYEQVAVWHGQINPYDFAYEMMRLGKFYNNAMVCPEVQGGGQLTIEVILRSSYPNVWLDKRPDRIKGQMTAYGWQTNFNRKEWAVGMLQKLILEETLRFHDRTTYNQLLRFVQDEQGYFGNEVRKVHDDAVMALAIAITASHMEGPFIAEPPSYESLELFGKQIFNDLPGAA